MEFQRKLEILNILEIVLDTSLILSLSVGWYVSTDFFYQYDVWDLRRSIWDFRHLHDLKHVAVRKIEKNLSKIEWTMRSHMSLVHFGCIVMIGCVNYLLSGLRTKMFWLQIIEIVCCWVQRDPRNLFNGRKRTWGSYYHFEWDITDSWGSPELWSEL